MIHRRDFLSSLFLAPAIVHSENLMKLWVPKTEIITKVIWEVREDGNGVYLYGFSQDELKSIRQKFLEIHGTVANFQVIFTT